jgi:hypothetical protein
MIFNFIRVILAIFLVLPAQAGENFEYGPRPPLAVFDPGGLLEPTVVKSISDPLVTIYQKEGIDVIVIVLKEIGQAPPEHVAGQFAAAWCKSPIHCMVLHVPGREGSPWIMPAGRLIGHINPEAVKTAVANAHRRVTAEADDTSKVKASATEAADMLRIWMGSAITQTTDIQTETAKMRLELEAQSRRWKLGVMIAAAAFIPLVAGIVLVVSLLNRRGPRHFSSNHWQRRLGAPYAGGNRAVADLGPRIS